MSNPYSFTSNLSRGRNKETKNQEDDQPQSKPPLKVYSRRTLYSQPAKLSEPWRSPEITERNTEGINSKQETKGSKNQILIFLLL